MLFEKILETIGPIWDRLNRTSIKRIVIYFILAYPVLITYLYHDEIKLILFNQQKMVVINDIASAQKECYDLRSKYYAETVSLYVYQPIGKNKTHKERMVFSTGSHYAPLESLRNINLYSRSRIIEDLRKQNYAIITQKSKHEESSVLIAYDLNKAIITPVIDQSTGLIIAEVVWIFKDDVKVNIEDLVRDSQIFGILINDNV